MALDYNAAMRPDNSTYAPGQRQFASTNWNLVVQAGRAGRPECRAALAHLCEGYWVPIYAFVRREGYSSADAQDLTQGFFTRLLEKGDLANVDPTKGKFRSFLLASLKHFLINEWDKARAVKRGGGKPPLSLNFNAAESRLAMEPSHSRTAEAVFDREWALTLLDRVRKLLAEENASREKQQRFGQLQAYLTAETAAPPYRLAAERLNMSEAAVKVAVHRLRGRFRELLRAEIRETVADETAVDDEIRELLSALGT